MYKCSLEQIILIKFMLSYKLLSLSKLHMSLINIFYYKWIYTIATTVLIVLEFNIFNQYCKVL